MSSSKGAGKGPHSSSQRRHSAVLGGVSLAVAVGTLALVAAIVLSGMADKTSPSVGHGSPYAWAIIFGNCFALLGGLVGFCIAAAGIFVGWGASPSWLTIAAVIVHLLLVAAPVTLIIIHANRGW
jgi:hypothetical protein